MRGSNTSRWFVAACLVTGLVGVGELVRAQGSSPVGSEVDQTDVRGSDRGAKEEKTGERGSADDEKTGVAEDETGDGGDGSEDGSEEGKEKEDEVKPRSELTRARRLVQMSALSRSVPHFEKALEHGAERPLPGFYTTAQRNYANVLLNLEEYERALLAYQAYINVAGKQGDASVRRNLKKARARVWKKRLATLSVTVEPERRSRIYIDGLLVQRNGAVDGMTLVSGGYDVRVEVPKYIPESKTVDLEMGGSQSLEFELRKKTFYGHADVQVDVEGATVRFEPKELKGPKSPGAFERKTPVEEPVKLITGKWLVEVHKENYHRWVRYVTIRKDKTQSVQVKLDKKLPKEIR